MYDKTSELLINQFCADYTTWLLGTPVELTKMEATELCCEPIRVNKIVLDSQSCADYTRWLLGTPVELADMQITDLYYQPIINDGLVLLKNDSLICHWEFQTDPDLNTAYRMIDYYVRLRGKYPDHRILQIVVYLQETCSDQVFNNCYRDKATFHEFGVVRLWEEEPEKLMVLPGLLPLAVLARTNNEVGLLKRVAELIEQLPSAQDRSNLMSAMATLAELKLEKNVINQVLR
jgi:predicted transposase YdaD